MKKRFVLSLFVFSSIISNTISAREGASVLNCPTPMFFPTPNGSVRIEDYSNNPEYSNYVFSPDGRRVACIKRDGGRRNVFITAFGGTKEMFATNYSNNDVDWISWVSDNFILFSMVDLTNGNNVLYSYNVSNQKIVSLGETTYRTKFLHYNPSHPDIVLCLSNERSLHVDDLYEVNIATGSRKLLEQNTGNYDAWVFDQNGKLSAVRSNQGSSFSILYRSNDGLDEWKTLVVGNIGDHIEPIALATDHSGLYCLSNAQRDFQRLVLIRFDSPSDEHSIYESSTKDVVYAKFSARENSFIYVELGGFRKERIILHESYAKMDEDVKLQIPADMDYEILDYNRGLPMFIIRTYSDSSPGAYYTYSQRLGKIEKLSDVVRGIETKSLGHWETFTFTNRDGNELQGYIMTPNNGTSSQFPLMIYVHDSPVEQPRWKFNPMIQFLVNQGYAVACIAFRGSMGYGKGHFYSTTAKCGVNAQSDILDGLQVLIDRQIVNPRKVGVIGTGYGGFIALKLLENNPDQFECGIDFAGMAELNHFMLQCIETKKPYLNQYLALFGDPNIDKHNLMRESPLYHVKAIKDPLMVAQGQNNSLLNDKQSVALVEEMKSNGLPVEFLNIAGEGNVLRLDEARLLYYSAVATFLMKNMPIQ